MDKTNLRKACLAGRRELAEEYRAAASDRIVGRLLALVRRLGWRLVSCYLSFDAEVATDSFVRACLDSGVRIAVPYVAPHAHRLYLSEIKDLSIELTLNRYGIREPKREYLRIIPVDTLDAIIVPGTAFSPDGARLGYGLGFYDRLLRDIRGRIPLIGLAFHRQVMAEIPCEDHDIPVDLVITEEMVHRSRLAPAALPDAVLTEEVV